MLFKLEDCVVSAVPLKHSGGMKTGRVSPTVSVLHTPTGLKAEATARSQHKSRQIAIEMIEYAFHTYYRDLKETQ